MISPIKITFNNPEEENLYAEFEKRRGLVQRATYIKELIRNDIQTKDAVHTKISETK